MLWKRNISAKKPSEYISRKDVMENVLAMSDDLSHGITDSETLQRWLSYFENLSYKIKFIMGLPSELTANPIIQPIQMNRIGDFLENMEDRDFAGALYEIYTILAVNRSKIHIGREEMILIYLLLKIALGQFQTETHYFMKPCSPNKPTVAK